MNRLSLVRYTSAVALGLSTLWSAAVCAAEDAGAFDKIQQIRAGDLNIGYVDIGPRNPAMPSAVRKNAMKMLWWVCAAAMPRWRRL